MMPIKTGDWIVGILSVEDYRPSELEEILDIQIRSQLARVHALGLVHVIRYERGEFGFPYPVYRGGEGKDAPYPELDIEAYKRSKNAKARAKRRAQPKLPKIKALPANEYKRRYRARKKVKVASVFQWRGPLRPQPREPIAA